MTGKLLLTISSLCWYLVCVTGFDVHFCGDDGHVYVKPLFAGISCEKIHPDTPCGHNGHGCCDDGEECCRDMIALLDVPGDGVDCTAAPAVPFPFLYAVFPERTFCPAISCRSVRVIPDSQSPPGCLRSKPFSLRI